MSIPTEILSLRRDQSTGQTNNQDSGGIVEGGGKEFLNEICRCDLEGIVAKRKMGMYREDRPDWLKIKNRTYSQAEGRHEILTRATKKN